MCSISVEPMPSTMSQPKCAAKRSPISPGSASPADEHRRKRDLVAAPAGPATRACRRSRSARRRRRSASRACGDARAPVQRLNTASGVGRSAISTTVAPTESGNVSALPSPYAKKSLAAENTTSRSVSAEHALAVQLGRPVRGWRACARCPWAGRSTPTNRARTPGRRRASRRARRAAVPRRRRRIEVDRIGAASATGGAGDDHVADFVRRARPSPVRKRRQQRRRDDRRLRAAVREHVGVVVDRQQRVDGDRDDAGVQRAEEGDRPVDACRASAGARAPRAERRAPSSAGGEAARAVVELAVAERAAIVDVGDLAGAAAVRRRTGARRS